MPDKPLTTDVLAAAFQRLTRSPDFVRRIKWWLTIGHSAERWLQFEYAHSLQIECDILYPNQYAVACEQQYADIVLFKLKHPLPDYRPIEKELVVAKLEVKFNGNWYTIGNTFSGISDDMNKVDGYKVPSVALAFWIFAEPTLDYPMNHSMYCWISKQVNSRRKRPTKEMVFGELENMKFTQIFPDPKRDNNPERNAGCEMLDFVLYEHRNRHA